MGETVCPELPTWRSMGSQPLSQMGRDAASSAPSAVGQILNEGQILGFLDAAADAHDERRGAEIDRLRRAAEGLAGLGANLRRRRSAASKVVTSAVPAWTASARNAPACTETKHGPLPGWPIIAGETALHELAREDRAVADGDHVADEHLAEARGKRRSEVAHLVGVRENHLRGAFLLDELLESDRVAVGRVGRQQRMLDADDPGHRFGRGFGRQRFRVRADHGACSAWFSLRGKMLAGGQGFPTGAAYAAVAFFQDNQNAAHSTRTSNFSFSTRAAAASFARAGQDLRGALLLRQGDRIQAPPWARCRRAEIRCGDAAHFLGLGALDAHQRGVAQLVAARLDGEHRGQRQLDGLEPAVLQVRASR